MHVDAGVRSVIRRFIGQGRWITPSADPPNGLRRRPMSWQAAAIGSLKASSSSSLPGRSFRCRMRLPSPTIKRSSRRHA